VLEFIETNGKGAGSEIIANVGITGDLQGYLMIQADLPSACNFVSKMLSNMEVEPEEEGFSQFHKEAIGEIVNQVSGRSVMNLSGREIDCNITPPTILTGSSMAYNVSNLDHVRWSDITGSFGTLSLFVGVKKIR
jgi:chemotaxis protein CheX